jgi:hypothetical protein
MCVNPRSSVKMPNLVWSCLRSVRNFAGLPSSRFLSAASAVSKSCLRLASRVDELLSAAALVFAASRSASVCRGRLGEPWRLVLEGLRALEPVDGAVGVEGLEALRRVVRGLR